MKEGAAAKLKNANILIVIAMLYSIGQDRTTRVNLYGKRHEQQQRRENN
jgi:hypothetical protein